MYEELILPEEITSNWQFFFNIQNVVLGICFGKLENKNNF